MHPASRARPDVEDGVTRPHSRGRKERLDVEARPATDALVVRSGGTVKRGVRFALPHESHGTANSPECGLDANFTAKTAQGRLRPLAPRQSRWHRICCQAFTRSARAGD